MRARHVSLVLLSIIPKLRSLTLFKDCKVYEASSPELMVVTADFARPSRKRGDPVNKSIDNVTVRTTLDRFANTKVHSHRYRSHPSIGRIRRLGQCLHTPEAQFGEGILVLLLDQSLANTDVGITDVM